VEDLPSQPFAHTGGRGSTEMGFPLGDGVGN
jgi:hypothetical protein